MALSDANIEALAESIVGGTEQRLVTELTNQLLDALRQGTMSGSDLQALETLSRTNASEVDAILAKNRDAITEETVEQVQAALTSAATEDMTVLTTAYGASAYASAMSSHFQAVSAETAQGVAEMIARDNVQMAQAAKDTWYQVAGDAITAINHGLEKRDDVIADAVSKLTDATMTTIDYKSGTHNQLDVAVRRHIVTQTSQAGGRMTMEALDGAGHTLVVVSSHFGARPSHAIWQGKAYSTREGGETVDGHFYPDFYAATGYEGRRGSSTALGDRLKGINCKHSYGPWFPGISKLPDTDFEKEQDHFGMTSGEYYDAAQHQRELERRIRKTKRDIAGMERVGLGLESPAYVQKRLVLGKQQCDLASWCSEKKLTRIPKYEKAYGIGAQPRALRAVPNVTTHAKTRLVEREVSDLQTADALANPLHKDSIKSDELKRRSQKIIGRSATVVVNPDTGAIITAYKTKSRYRRKYEKGDRDE